MNAITTPTCWCGAPATMTVPIDPMVTPWDGELRQSDGSPALATCQEHARDGYELLELPTVAELDAELEKAAEEDLEAKKAVELLARLILADDQGDLPGSLELMARVLPPHLWARLAEACEVCPVHFSDVRICEDDQDPGCSAGREAAAR